MNKHSLVLLIAVVIALLMTGFAVYQLLLAEREARIADVANLVAQSASLRNTHFDLSQLLSVEAFHAANTPQSRRVLLDSLRANPQLVRYAHGEFGMSSVAFSPDGKTLATGDENGNILSPSTAIYLFVSAFPIPKSEIKSPADRSKFDYSRS